MEFTCNIPPLPCLKVAPNKQAMRRDFESLTLSSIPSYLQDSEFNFSLNYDDPDTFFVPNGVTKRSVEVHSVEDFKHLLSTVRFWGLRSIPNTLYEFALVHDSQEICEACKEFEAELSFLSSIAEASAAPEDKRMDIAMKCGCVELVKYLYVEGHTITNISIDLTMENGHVECLKYALSATYDNLAHVVSSSAVLHKNEACIQAVLDRYSNSECFLVTDDSIVDAYPVYSLCDVAASIGNIDYIKSALDRGWYCNSEILTVAAANGQLECMKYLREIVGCEWSLDTAVLEAVQCKQFDCVEYALRNDGYFIDDIHAEVVTGLVAAGELRCLTLLHPDALALCSEDLEFCVLAAQHGNLGCLTFLHEHDYVWDEEVTTAAAETSHFDCLWYAIQQGCAVDTNRLPYLLANKDGGDSLLIHLAQIGIPTLTMPIAICAATMGFLTCLMHMADSSGEGKEGIEGGEGGEWLSAAVSTAAAAAGHLSCLQFLHEQGAPWNQSTTLEAARGEQYDCLEYALQQRCAVEVCTYQCLASRGELRLLAVVLEQHQQGVDHTFPPLKRQERLDIVTAAAQHGQLVCLQYLLEQCGLPTSTAVSSAAVRHGQWECARYLQQRGCAFIKTAARKLAHSAPALTAVV